MSCPRKVVPLLSVLILVWWLVLLPHSSLAAQSEAAQRQYQQGATLFRQRHYDEAAEALKKAIGPQPQMSEAHHLLGLVLFEGKKEPAEAIESIKKAVQLNPTASLPSSRFSSVLAPAYLCIGSILL